MKLKFRAEKKDVIAFIWACLLLLVIVSIVVYNVKDITNETVAAAKTGISFNPIAGLIPPYLPYTIVFWLVAIIILTASLSSHFFEREKGFGFKEGKKEDGFGRFAKEDEYKNAPGVEAVDMSAKESTAAGFPLVYDKKKNLVYVDNGEFHSLVIGATGSGKTSRVINQQVNLLAKKGESMVITDPKGEIYAMHGELLKQLGYDVIVVNFRDPKNGSCWNPYTLPYKYYKEGNQDKANELLNDMAINIATDEKADDPFWTNSAADFLTGLSLGMFEDAAEDEISISTVNLMMTVGDEKIGSSTYLKEYFKMKDPASPAAINALGTINAPQETKNSIDSVLKQKIKVFAVTQNLSEMLSRSDFDMETIGERKTAVFMVIQDEKTTYHALATIFVKQCYESLIAVAQRHGGKLPIRTNFLLDEFANMPKFKDITTMITAARSRQIRMTMIIQNFAQLVQVYGKEDAETIRGNCGNLLYLLTGELSALEEISKLCGDKIVKVGKDKREETRPLITVTELQRFKMGEVLLLRYRLPPLKTKIPGYFEIDFGWGKNNSEVPEAKLPTHEQRAIKLFDIREFVKKKREEKRNEQFGFGNSPFGGGNPFASPGSNPFGNQGGNPFASPGSNPFGNQGGNPFAQPGSNPFGNQGSNPFASQNSNPLVGNSNSSSTSNLFDSEGSNNSSNDEDLNIDDLIKKIDSKIAELEEEEKKGNEAKDNEEVASEKQMVEDLVKPEDNKEDDSDSSDVLSSNAILSSSKIDFSTFENPTVEKKEVKHDIMEDFLEDLSIEDNDEKQTKPNINEQIKEDDKEEPAITPEFISSEGYDVAINDDSDEIIEDAITTDDEKTKDVYVNKDEVDKIMNETESINDDDDFFDEFFE